MKKFLIPAAFALVVCLAAVLCIRGTRQAGEGLWDTDSTLALQHGEFAAFSTDSELAPADETGKTPRGKVPVICNSELPPDPMRVSEFTRILDYAEPLAPAGQRVWFIVVNYSVNRVARIRVGRTDWWRVKQALSHPVIMYWSADVYFTPDANAGRVRKGKAVNLKSDELQPKLALAADQYDYIMVSSSDAPFGKELVTPAKKLLPFAQPEGFSDEEIVELIDFARSEEDLGPILYIERQEDGSVEITDGVEGDDYLSGYGSTLRCVKREGRWVATGGGSWMR